MLVGAHLNVAVDALVGAHLNVAVNAEMTLCRFILINILRQMS